MSDASKISVLLVLLLSGCAGPTVGPEDLSDEILPAKALESIAMDACSGASLGIHWPGDTNPAPAPETWGRPPNTVPFTTIGLVALSCSRLGIGDLERPASIVIEMTSAIRPPDGCLEGGESLTQWFAYRSWVNDSLVAQALRVRGFPVMEADISFRTSNGLLTTTDEWAIETEGGSGGLTIQHEEALDRASREGLRIFWDHGGGISYWDTVLSGSGPSTTNRVAIGTAAPESLAGQFEGRFVAPSEPLRNASLRGEGAWTSDYSCS